MITELLRMLKRCWYEKRFSFHYECKDGYLKISNTITVAIISKNREKEIEVALELLNDEGIFIDHINLVDVYNNVNNKSHELSRDIGKYATMKIEKGEYITTREDCKQYNVS